MSQKRVILRFLLIYWKDWFIFSLLAILIFVSFGGGGLNLASPLFYILRYIYNPIIKWTFCFYGNKKATSNYFARTKKDVKRLFSSVQPAIDSHVVDCPMIR